MMATLSGIFLLTALTFNLISSQRIIPTVNVDALLSNKAYTDMLFACISKIDTETCDRVGKTISEVVLPDVAKTGKCNLCNDQEKEFVGKAARIMKDHYPFEWETLINAYQISPEIQPKLLQEEMETSAS